MSGRTDEEAARRTRVIAVRAIRRLDVLEWLILSGAVIAAVVGGWLIAWLLAESVGLSFRLVWVVSSLVLFGGPGSVALIRLRREEREWQAKLNKAKENHG